MTTGNDNNLAPLEMASAELNEMVFDNFKAESMHNELWDMFMESLIHRGDQGAYDLYPRAFLYNSLRNLFTELGKIERDPKKFLKITYEPVTPSQS